MEHPDRPSTPSRPKRQHPTRSRSNATKKPTRGSRFKRALVNVVSNGVKLTPAGGRIDLICGWRVDVSV